MARFIIRRLISMVFVLVAVSILVFVIFNVIPNGDPAARMAGKNATQEQIAAIKVDWGFDKSLPEQYVKTMQKVLSGDTISYFTQLNVVDEIKKGLPRTFWLSVGAAIIWMFFGVGFGLISAMRAGKFTDRGLTVLALIGISMPVFWIGALMNYYLGFKWKLLPNGGYVEFSVDPWQWFVHLILPWTALSILFIGVYSRVLRGNILETVNEDFVRTARAKGLSERRVLLKHVLRNSLIPIVTLWGLDFGAVIGGGAILTESVFNLQGVGQYAADSIGQLDQPPIMVVTLFGAFFIVLFNAIVDVGYAALDPRIRLGETTA
jgi:peptide/nickel transport system permease protein